MNITFKNMIDLALDDIVANPNSVHTAAVKRYINQAHATVCASKKIEALTVSATLTPVSGECVLPSDCSPNSIESVGDSDGNKYFRDESRGRGSALYQRNYFISGMADVLAESDTGSIDEGGTTLTTQEDTFLPTHVGEFVSIGDTGGLYQIATFTSATSVEIDQNYRGEAETSAHVAVRPFPTMKIKFVDIGVSAILPDSITVTYQKSPLPLYNDYDLLMCPGSGEDIRAMCLQSMLRRLGKSREARMMSDEVRVERSLAAKDGSHKRNPYRATRFFTRGTNVAMLDPANIVS